MQNFIKTIINSVRNWVKGEIKKSKADWNQNDSNADNYVKNRTHWEEDGVIHKLDSKYFDVSFNDLEDKPFYEYETEDKYYYWDIQEITFTLEPNGIYSSADSTNYEMFPFSGILCACFDGVEYEGEIFDTGDFARLEININGDTFYIRNDGRMTTADGDSETAERWANTTHTISVYTKGLKTTTKTIDTKYLPEALRFGEIGKVIVPPTKATNNKVIGEYSDLITVGTTCIVTFNDIDYECVAYELEGAVAIGNGKVVGLTGGNDEPFLIGMFPELGIVLYIKEGSPTVSVRIPELKPLDIKYLPHYEEVKEVVYIPKTVGTVVEGSGINHIEYDSSLIPNWTYGNKLFIKWDGIEYECTCYEDFNLGEIVYSFSVDNNLVVSFGDYGRITSFGSSYLVVGETHTYEVYANEMISKPLDSYYLNNHTHSWKDSGEEKNYKTIAEEQTIRFNSSYVNYNKTESGNNLYWDQGEPVRIVFDGVIYDTTTFSTSVQGDRYIGAEIFYDNKSILILLDSFFLCNYNGVTGKHTLAIYKPFTSIKTLDTKYLPKHLHFGEDNFVYIKEQEITFGENNFTKTYIEQGYSSSEHCQVIFDGNVYNVIIDYWDPDLGCDFNLSDGTRIAITMWNNFAEITASSNSFANTTHTIKFVSLEKTEFYTIDEKYISNSIARTADHILSPLSAKIGQTIIVKSVDESGKPITWEAVDHNKFNHFILADLTTSYEHMVYMKNGNLTSVCKATSIEVTTLPNKIAYVDDEEFDVTGMVVTVYRQDGTFEAIENYDYEIQNIPYLDVVVSYNEFNNIYTTNVKDILTTNFETITNNDSVNNYIEELPDGTISIKTGVEITLQPEETTIDSGTCYTIPVSTEILNNVTIHNAEVR